MAAIVDSQVTEQRMHACVGSLHLRSVKAVLLLAQNTCNAALHRFRIWAWNLPTCPATSQTSTHCWWVA